MSGLSLLRLVGIRRCGRPAFPPLAKGGPGGVGTHGSDTHSRLLDQDARSSAALPLTRPAADLSPTGRGEEYRVSSLASVTTTGHRPRPHGERVGVRGPERRRSARISPHFLAILVVSGTVSAVVTSALVIAQVPKTQPGGVTTTVKVEAVKRDAGKEGQKVEAEPPKAVGKAAKVIDRVLVRQANALENQVQQYMRQARPIVRAELIFVRKICELDMEHFRLINHDAEAAFKEAAKTFVQAQQQGRVRLPGQGRPAPAVDGLAMLHEGLSSVMKKDLTSEQFGHYQAEVEKRDANRKQSAVRFLVDAMDRDLYLSGQQRLKLTESLLAHWDHGWSMSLEYLLYGNQFYPQGIDAYVTPVLDATQKKIWQATQKLGGIGGIGGVFGGFMNDNDALEVELGEARNADPAHGAPIRRVEVQKR